MSTIIRWDKTQATWHTDIDRVGRYAVARTKPRGPYAAFLNGDRIVGEPVHSDAEIVKRAVESRIETARRINAGDSDKVQVGTVDMTPYWGDVLGILLDFHAHGTVEQRDIAHRELVKMASAADAYNAMQKELRKQIAVSEAALGRVKERLT